MLEFKQNPCGVTMKAAWKSIQSIEERLLFYIIAFSVAEVPRVHNIVKGVDDRSAGKGDNDFAQDFMRFVLAEKYISKNEKEILTMLYAEFVNLRDFITYEVKTAPGTNRFVKEVGLLKDFLATNNGEMLCDYISNLINSNDKLAHYQIAKDLCRPRVRPKKTKAGKEREILPQSKMKDLVLTNFIRRLSEKMGWEVAVKENYFDFYGFRKWKSAITGDKLLSKIASSGVLRDYSEGEVLAYMKRAENGTRDRLKRMVLNSKNEPRKPCYENAAKGILRFYEEKKTAQETLRQAKKEEEVTGVENYELMQKLKKEAKVNVGATCIKKLIQELYASEAVVVISYEMEITDEPIDFEIITKLEHIVERTNFNLNILPVIDVSGSMLHREKQSIPCPYFYACFMTTLALLKQEPSRRAFISFASRAKVITADKVINAGFDTSKPFTFNMNVIMRLCQGSGTFNGGTSASTIAPAIQDFLDSHWHSGVEYIKSCGALMFFSDGELNNQVTPSSSLDQLRYKLEDMGYEGISIIIEVSNFTNAPMKFHENIKCLHLPTFNADDIALICEGIDVKNLPTPYDQLLRLYDAPRYRVIKDNMQLALGILSD